MKRSIQKKISKLKRDEQTIRDELIEIVKKWDQKISGVKSLSNKCAVVSSSNLVNGMFSADLYIPGVQVNTMIDLINRAPVENIPDRIDEIFRTQKWGDVRFHPDFIKYLKEQLHE